MTVHCRILLVVCLLLVSSHAFVPPCGRYGKQRKVECFAESQNDRTSSYETSDASSKGIVSSLTGLVNVVMTPTANNDDASSATAIGAPPTSPDELMKRIRDDYTEKNYLWTGDINLACIEEDCRFTDPTLSFTGRDTFVRNVQNLQPLVDALLEQPDDCRSDLLEIRLKEKYVESRWNMVGKLGKLFWKPEINVVGRTKFWYRPSKGGEYRVYFYDECWEIPATQALLQLITPAGTIPKSSGGNDSRDH